jgi:hypothetical protein
MRSTMPALTPTAGSFGRSRRQSSRIGTSLTQKVRDDAFSLDLHVWQLRELLRLGEPPQARPLYDEWVANFRARVAVERNALAFERRNQFAAANRELGLLVKLRDQRNLAGQKFGLVRCTSNGERTPVPILNDGQPEALP